jgi:hypothetical protein
MIGRALLGSLALAVAWTLLIAISAGIGLAIRGRVFSERRIRAHTLIAAFWLGMAVTVLLLQLWHLFWPINAAAFVLLVATAAIGFAEHARALRAWTQGLHRPTALATAAALALAALWLGNRGLAAVANFDTYMYHVPAVEWYKQYPLVPGLGNLHERFAFNNASFLYAALLESALWARGSTHLVNGVFVLAFLAGIIARFAQHLNGSGVRGPTVFDLVLLGPVLAVGTHAPMFAGLTPDLPAGLAILAGFSLLVSAVWNVPADPDERAFTLFVAGTTFALAATLKLSVAGGALPAWIITAFVLWRMNREQALLRGRMLLMVAGFSTTLVGLWVTRGMMTSGYPLYPSTLAGLPVDWQIPAENARASYDWIAFFARLFHDPTAYNAGDWSAYVCSPTAWIGPWFRDLLHPEYLWQIPVPVVLVATFGVLAARGRARRELPPRAWFLLLPPAMAIVMWWVVAPRPLFGYWAFWLAAAVVAAAAAPALPKARWLFVFAVTGALGVMSLPLLGAGVEAARATEQSNLAAAAGVWFVQPDSASLIQRTRWDFPLRPYETRSGLTLYVPTGHRCGRAQLPCTSHPSPSLELREPGRMRSGFRARGEWVAERWPNPWNSFLANWRAPVSCGEPTPRGSRGTDE